MDIEASIGLRLDGVHSELVKIREAQEAADAAVRERFRGIKPMRIPLEIPGVPTIAALAAPAQGCAWNLKLLTGSLTGSDSVVAYVGNNPADAPNNRIIGYATAPGAAPAQNVFVISWSSDQGLLFPGEGVVIQTSGAFRFNWAMMYAVQTPAEMIGKILT